MEKTTITNQPTSGGLQPVHTDVLPYKTGINVQYICTKITIIPRANPSIINDNIRTDYVQVLTAEDGEEISRKNMAYVVRDTGEVWEHDVDELGEIVPDTGVKIGEAEEPLAIWEMGMGDAIRSAVIAQMLTKNGL